MGKPDQQYRHSVLRLQRFLRLGERKNLERIRTSFDRPDPPFVVVFFSTVTLLIYLANHPTHSTAKTPLPATSVGEKDPRDGNSTGDPHFRLSARSKLDSPSDHVLSSLPALHERDPGKPLGKTTGNGVGTSCVALRRRLFWVRARLAVERSDRRRSQSGSLVSARCFQ